MPSPAQKGDIPNFAASAREALSTYSRRRLLASAAHAAAGVALGLAGARSLFAQAPARQAAELGGDFHLLKAGAVNVLAYSAGNALIGSARGDRLWLFGLDGTLPPAQSGTPVRRPPD